MPAIELETTIDSKGNIHLPLRYKKWYGKKTKLVMYPPTEVLPIQDLSGFRGRITLSVDPLEFQRQIRGEWS